MPCSRYRNQFKVVSVAVFTHLDKVRYSVYVNSIDCQLYYLYEDILVLVLIVQIRQVYFDIRA